MQIGILVIGAVFVGIYESFATPMSSVDSLSIGVLGVLFISLVAFIAVSYKSLAIDVMPDALIQSTFYRTWAIHWSDVSVVERRPKYRASQVLVLRDSRRRRLFEIDSQLADFEDLWELVQRNAPTSALVRVRDQDGTWQERTNARGDV